MQTMRLPYLIFQHKSNCCRLKKKYASLFTHHFISFGLIWKHSSIWFWCIPLQRFISGSFTERICNVQCTMYILKHPYRLSNTTDKLFVFLVLFLFPLKKIIIIMILTPYQQSTIFYRWWYFTQNIKHFWVGAKKANIINKLLDFWYGNRFINNDFQPFNWLSMWTREKWLYNIQNGSDVLRITNEPCTISVSSILTNTSKD